MFEFSNIFKECMFFETKLKGSKMRMILVKVILYKIFGLGCVSVLEKCVG
jgi:hypothetical protein